MSVFNRSVRTKFVFGLGTGAVVVALVLILWWLNWFVGVRLRLSNLFYVPQPTSGNVVLVAIDENSISTYGAYQDWSRERYAEVVDALVDDGVRVIVFDMIFSEPREGDRALEGSLANAREAGTRIVLPAPTVTVGGVQTILDPLPELVQHTAHIAHIHTQLDAIGTVRFQNSYDEQHERFFLPVAAYLAYFNVSATLAPEIVQRMENALVLPGDLTLPVDENGMWMTNFFGEPGDTFETYSVSSVIEGEFAASTFDDKVVYVGLFDTVGAADKFPTPISTLAMPGVEINAHALETLFSKVPLRYETAGSQVLTIVLLGFLTSIMFALFRWYTMIGLAVLVALGWFIYASVMFSVQHLVVNALHPIMTIALALMLSIGVRMSYEVYRRRRVESLLQSLVQVSEQQMELSRIIPLVAEDLQTMTHAPAGSIWMPGRKKHLQAVYRWGDGRDQQMTEIQQIESDSAHLTIPVVWQGRVVAVFALQQPIRPGSLQQVRRFTERIAAVLENARLFGETQSQNQLLQGILSESPAGILVLDDALNLQRYNESVGEWLNIEGIDFVGQPISAALEASSIDEDTWQKIGENLLAEQPFRQEIKVRGRTYQLDAAHIPGGQRWVMTLSDISELAELSQVKTRMIRMASHDLKNPLGRVIGYGELLQEMLDDLSGPDDAHQFKPILGRIVKSAEEMNNIITEILSLEHIRAGRIEREPLDLANIALNVVERYQSDAESKQQTLLTNFSEDVPLIRGDFNHLVQSISNLVGNAIKYTPDGGEIRVSLKYEDGLVRLAVKDNGYGMPKEAQESLFTEFYRIRTEKTKAIKGTGLGLSLVKSVIEAHGGRVWVESELDVGSTFTIELSTASDTSELAGSLSS